MLKHESLPPLTSATTLILFNLHSESLKKIYQELKSIVKSEYCFRQTSVIKQFKKFNDLSMIILSYW